MEGAGGREREAQKEREGRTNILNFDFNSVLDGRVLDSHKYCLVLCLILTYNFLAYYLTLSCPSLSYLISSY